MNGFIRKNILESYSNKVNSEIEDFIEKGKKATIGEIRVWNGKKEQKQADGSWKEVSSGVASKYKVGDTVLTSVNSSGFDRRGYAYVGEVKSVKEVQGMNSTKSNHYEIKITKIPKVNDKGSSSFNPKDYHSHEVGDIITSDEDDIKNLDKFKDHFEQ